MTDYITPGRKPHSAAAKAVNTGDGGSAGRRVVRSALELLAETPSPDLMRETMSSHSAAGPSKFTVTYATAPMASLRENAQHDQQLQQRRWPTTTTTTSLGNENNVVVSAIMEEPSTLLFLSPTGAGAAGSGVKKRLFKKKKKTTKLSDSVRKAAVSVMAKEMQFLETSTIQGGYSEEEKENEVGRARGRTPVGGVRNEKNTENQNRLLRENEPLFTEEEVQQRILEALKAYEKRRDEEEESVLQEVGREIESQNERYERLLKEKSTVVEERDALQIKKELLVRQCELLQNTVAELHRELQETQDRASRAEVELCHAQDEKRLTSSGLQQELNFEKAQWKLAQEEMQRQITEFDAQLKSRTFEWHELQEAARAKEAERARISEQLDACQGDLKQMRQRHSEIQRTNAELQGLVEAKETLIRQLQLKVQEAEKAVKHATTLTQDEQTQIESRLRSVEEALQQQTDEVRRKMHRVHVLETELGKAEKLNKVLRRTVDEATNCFFSVHSSLETFVESFRTPRPVRTSQQFLRNALFPGAERYEMQPHNGMGCDGDMYDYEYNDAYSSCREDQEDGEEGDEHGDDSFFDLITCKELRDDLRRGLPSSGKTGLSIQQEYQKQQQQQKPNAQRFRGGLRPNSIRKNGANEDTEEVDESGRLQRCQRQCRRLLDTLRRIIVQRQKELRRQVKQVETRQAEQTKAEMKRCEEALATCQRNLEESKQEGRLLNDECRQRADEVKRLEATVAELRVAEQEMKSQQKGFMEHIEELQRNRGILHMQLEASQQNCVELRERYESMRLETEELRERLRPLENNQRSQEEALEAKAKVLARLARCSEKLKKTEGECQTLREENESLSTKVKSMLLQLQTSRMQQRSKSTAASSVRHQHSDQQQQQPQEELKALTREVAALRKLQESAATLHTKERTEAESSLNKLSKRNEELRHELAQQKHLLADALSEVEMQKRAEVMTLRTLLSIHQGGMGVSNDTCAGGNSPRGVHQRLFDTSPTLDAEDNPPAKQGEVTAADLRGRVVSLAQRTVLELTRVKEMINQAPCNEPEERLESFRAAEKLACEAAERSAARRQSCAVGNNVESGTPVLSSSRRTAPLLRNSVQHQQQQQLLLQQLEQQQEKLQRSTLGTPARRSGTQKSPSPKQVDGETIPSGFHPRRRSVSFTSTDVMKTATRNGQSMPRQAASSSSLSSTTTGGVSRSRSFQCVLDGSCSPARPPMLGAPSSF